MAGTYKVLPPDRQPRFHLIEDALFVCTRAPFDSTEAHSAADLGTLPLNITHRLIYSTSVGLFSGSRVLFLIQLMKVFTHRDIKSMLKLLRE